MAVKLKALGVVLVLGWLAAGAGCTLPTNGDEEEPPRIVTAEDGGQEEILRLARDDDDGDPSKLPSKAGEMAVVFGVIAYAVGAAVLPFLLL